MGPCGWRALSESMPVNNCCECRYWEEADIPELDGLAICIKRSLTIADGGVVVRTRGDDSCDKFRPLTVDNLFQTRQGHRQ
jgi:hypothetical protein